MTPADHARNNAISLEAKKDALSQRQSGDWRVSFTVQGIDMDTRLTQAPMGTRYAMVLVEINDDETPVNRKGVMPDTKSSVQRLDARPQPTQPQAGAKREWRDLQPQQQAGIRCNEPTFVAYLKEEYPNFWREADSAAECVRMICDVHSRVELGTNETARRMWFTIDAQYQAWLAKERVV